MKVLLLTTDSPAQRALARSIDAADELELVGVAVQSLRGSGTLTSVLEQLRRRPVRLLDRLLTRVLFSRTIASLHRTERSVFGDGSWPPTARLQWTDDINAPVVVELIAATRPEAIAVSGTRLVRSPVFDTAPPKGLFNLHTGLSPYYKGGPNCTLWCLANADPAHLGATVHVLDPGIDSGPLLRTVRTPVTRLDTVADLVARTTQVGQQAYLDVLRAVAREESLSSVEQSTIGPGRTYLTREWNVGHMARAVWFVRRGGLRRWLDRGAGGSPELIGTPPGGLPT
jgi:folate-dependent phosphoribosylglycinamide formyltransferase PurN